MCHAAVNWVINEAKFPAEIRPQARWLLVHIADRANRDHWECWPSHKVLAEDAGMTSRSVLNLLAELEDAGFITRREQRRGDGSRGTDIIALKRPEKFSVPGKEQQVVPKNTTGQGEKSSVQKEGREPGKGTDGANALVAAGDESVALQAFKAWNNWADRHAKAQALSFTDQRRRALNARIKQVGSFVGFLELLGRIERSPFLMGSTSHRFAIDLDFVLQPSSFTKILEGKYEDRHERPDPASPSGLSRRAENAVQGLMEAPDPRRGRWSI